MSEQTLLLPASAARSQAHPSCVLIHQDTDIASGIVKSASIHPDPKARLGYRAVVIQPNGDLGDHVGIRPGARGTRTSAQRLSSAAIVLSYHFGGVYGQGKTCVTEWKKKEGDSTEDGPLELVSRPAVPEDFSKGIFKEATNKNGWLSSFLCENYDDAVLPPFASEVARPRRPVMDTILRFAEERGIELDQDVVATTDRADIHPFPMCGDEQLADMLQYPKIWDSVMNRGYSSEFYGMYRGVAGSAEKLDVEGMDREQILAYASSAKQAFHQVLRVTTVFHSNSHGRYPHFYMFMLHDSATINERKTTSTYTTLLARYVSGELSVEADEESRQENYQQAHAGNPFSLVVLKEAA